MSECITAMPTRLTIREVAARLGVSRQTVYKYIRQGALKAYVWKANSRMYVKASDPAKMLDDHF